ncbi:phytanoyl-CoA dioxygenase family protein [Pseudonocardia sp. GCM10023141]|uniref:phytanoyl-CoA dioxygenase family protein n=1 Tax=Pseudonocardia sp. GCM10023141 TaxID=3252653 RepID=UPI00362079BD
MKPVAGRSGVEPTGELPNEVAVGERGDADRFDREGHAVGRQMFPPDVVRALRAPLVEALVADGQVQVVDELPDCFRWIGDPETFDRDRYRSVVGRSTDELLVRSGTAAAAIEKVWGRRPVMWDRAVLFAMPPGDPTRVHRDGWQMMGVGGPQEHLNVWFPVTRLGLGDGVLAVAAGSHGVADQEAAIAMPHPVHLDVEANTSNRPLPDRLAPLWRAAPLDVGDAVLFRPDIVHSTTLNDGPFLRLAVGLGAQDAAVPLARPAGLSSDVTRDLAEVEWLVLALLSVQPTSPWLARYAFYPRGVIGRLGIEYPDELVERTFSTLGLRGLIEPHTTYSDDQSSIHRYFQATPSGRCAASRRMATRESTTAADRRLFAVQAVLADWLRVDSAELFNESRPGLGPERNAS